MAPFAREVLINAARNKYKLTIIIEQSKCNETLQVVVFAVRVGGRSLSITSWRRHARDGRVSGNAMIRAAITAIAGSRERDAIAVRTAST